MTARGCAPRPRGAPAAAPRTSPQRIAIGEPPQRLHNMSAPPRATISFRPVALRDDSGIEHVGTGLRWVCRIDVPAFFWPLPKGVARDIAQCALWQDTLEPQRRLLAQALAEEGGLQEPGFDLTVRVNTMPAEAVLEALRDAATRADPVALGLPAFGLLRTARGARSRQCTQQMRLALAVLARRRGGIFLRAADPLPPASVTEPFDLWTTEPAVGADRSPAIAPLLSRAGVVPAQAGTQCLCIESRWIPASEGMTHAVRGRLAEGAARKGTDR